MRGLGDGPIMACSNNASARGITKMTERLQLLWLYPSHPFFPSSLETCQVENVPGGSFGKEFLHVDCPLVVTPTLLPGLQNGLLQVHHLHDFTLAPVAAGFEVREMELNKKRRSSKENRGRQN